MDYRRIDFEQELEKGPQTYNLELGEWWEGRTQDASHRYAYRKITECALSLFPKKAPQQVIDYACGAGHMLTRLYRPFSTSSLIGIDGSSLLLERAQGRLRRLDREWSRRVRFIETELPDFSLTPAQADLLVFIFPNIVPDPDDHGRYNENGYRHEQDAAVAKYLAHAREPDPELETVQEDPEILYDSLLTDKVIARNLRGLLKPGGICVRADYANAPREELTDLVRQRLEFEEGSLSTRVDGHQSEQIFALQHSVYFRSKVVEDVYHQTRDETDRQGGYLISVLSAV